MSSQDAHATAPLDPLMDASFSEPSMQERVELITHLLRHSDRLFTIMSDDATVLNGFSHKLTRHDTQGLHYAEVYPSAGMDAEDIVMHLARAWGVEVDFGETAMNALFQRLPAMLTEPRRAVAIIHLADTLPPMILDGLIGFVQRLDELLDGRVRLILTGSSLLTQRIAPMQALGDAGQVYALHLQPLASTPISEGFVSAAAAAVLDPSETTPNPPPRVSSSASSHAGSSNTARGLIFGGLGVSLLLAVVVAMILRPDAPETPKDTTVSIPLNPSPPETQSEPAPVAETSPAAVEPVVQSTAAAMPVPEAAAIAQTAPTAPAPATSTTQPNATQPSVYAPVPPKAVEAKLVEAPHVAKAETSPAVVVKPVQATPVKAETKAKATTQSSERFAASNASQYVLQIITFGSTKAVNAYIKTHDLEDCQSFHQQRDGKELFSLTCGLYPNREAALAAQSKLPTGVSAAKPYPRQVADIRKVMLP
ncbi:MAG: hypothetical protein B7Y40_04850 [Gammaproteobacteria bacterium 28-57-27]|nr:MAG: hypothetical protein B7Y40_04850 [Gammaproteobacteria bacterium 28-57-27]